MWQIIAIGYNLQQHPLVNWEFSGIINLSLALIYIMISDPCISIELHKRT